MKLIHRQNQVSNIINLDDYRDSKPSCEEEALDRLIDINKSIIELHDASMLNYEHYKIYLSQLIELVEHKGERDA